MLIKVLLILTAPTLSAGDFVAQNFFYSYCLKIKILLENIPQVELWY